MKTRTLYQICVILCVSCLISAGAPSLGYAQAQDAEPSAEEVEKAQTHFAQGAEYFYKEDYAKAVVEFLNAYKYSPDSMILYNLSMAHAKLGNFDEAYKAAARAQEMGGMADSAALRNDARLDAWHLVIVGESRARQIAEAPAQPTVVEVSEPDSAPFFQWPELSIIGWSGVGASALGIGLLSYATYANISMRGDMDAYEAAAERGDSERYHQLNEDLSKRQTAGLVTLYSGLALTAAGVGLITFDLLKEDDARASSAQLTSTPDGQGASVQILYEFR